MMLEPELELELVGDVLPDVTGEGEEGVAAVICVQDGLECGLCRVRGSQCVCLSERRLQSASESRLQSLVLICSPWPTPT